MKRRVVLSLSLLTLLTGCLPLCNCGEPSVAPDGVRPSATQLEPSALVSAHSGTPLIVEGQGNCPVNEIEIPGEVFRVKGGIGGLAIAPNPIGIIPGRAQEVGKVIADFAAPAFAEPAVLLVVDDFNGSSREAGIYFIDQQEGPTLADLSSGATEADVSALEAQGQYSHGALVFNHMLALLSALQPQFEVGRESVAPLPGLEQRPSIFAPRQRIAAEFSVEVAYLNRPNLRVVAVDTEDFSTEVISERVAATVAHFAAQQVRRFAVNLSFGLVPCSVLRDFEAGRQPGTTFETYQQEVAEANGITSEALRTELASLLTTPVGREPLRDFAGTGLSEGAEIVYLAAAGNYRLPYSLYPGYWSEFVSVSAKNLASAADVLDGDYSNVGEVLLGGGYYQLAAYDPGSGSWLEYDTLSVAGTSFAAPVLSVFTALDLTNTTPHCTRRGGDIASPLAFFKTDPPISTPVPALNVPLSDALRHYCP